MLRGVRACSRKDEATFIRRCDRQPNHLFAFLVRKCRRFTGGSDRDDAGDGCSDLGFDQFFESRIVDAAIAKWRHQRRKRAAKHWKRLKRYKGYKVKRHRGEPFQVARRANLNLDRAFKNEFSGTRKRDVVKLIIALFKSNLKFVSPAGSYTDRSVHLFDSGEDKRACDYARAARQRFVFHAAFVGAGSDFLRSTFLNEIHICALRRKHFVITNG